MISDDDEDAINRFHKLRGAWLMQFRDGWYAYCGDEQPIGPFPAMAEAVHAGQETWGKKQTPI